MKNFLVTPYRKVRRYVRHLRYPCTLLFGPEKTSGLPLRILMAGSFDPLLNFKGRVFSDAEEDALGTVWASQLDSLAAEHQVDLLLLCPHPRPSTPLPSEKAGFEIPANVMGEVSRAEAERVTSKYDPGRRVGIKNNKMGLTLDISHSREDLEEFYRRMAIPYTEKKFTGSVHMTPLEQIKSLCSDISTVRLFQDGRWIAGGSVGVFPDGLLQLFHLGEDTENPPSRKAGSFESIYHHILCSFDYWRVNRAELGRTVPFLKDGILYHKSRWGMHLRPVNLRMRISVMKWNAATRVYLHTHPFASSRGEDLNAVLAYNGDMETLAHDLKRLRMNGLSGLTLLHPENEPVDLESIRTFLPTKLQAYRPD